jgi:hypothetical protein
MTERDSPSKRDVPPGNVPNFLISNKYNSELVNCQTWKHGDVPQCTTLALSLLYYDLAFKKIMYCR